MWSKVGMGGEHHRYYKHTKFHQNLRGDPKFLVDLTRNDPYTVVSCSAEPVLLVRAQLSMRLVWNLKIVWKYCGSWKYCGDTYHGNNAKISQ